MPWFDRVAGLLIQRQPLLLCRLSRCSSSPEASKTSQTRAVPEQIELSLAQLAIQHGIRSVGQIVASGELVSREKVPWGSGGCYSRCNRATGTDSHDCAGGCARPPSIALQSGEAGKEIEGPMAIVILGGLLTTTSLNLLVLPALTLRYGTFGPQPVWERVHGST